MGKRVIYLRCGGCGRGFVVAGDTPADKHRCPGCGADVAVRARVEPQRSAGAPPKVPVRPLAAPRTFDVNFDVVPTPQQAVGPAMTGTMTILPDRITASGKPRRLPSASFAILLSLTLAFVTGGCFGLALWAVFLLPLILLVVLLLKYLFNPSRYDQGRRELNPKESEAFYDEARRSVSLRLPDGQWLTATVFARHAKMVFARFLQALFGVYGNRMERADLNRPTRREARMRLGLWITLALGAIVFIIMAVGLYWLKS